MMARNMLFALALIVPAFVALAPTASAQTDGSVQLTCQSGPEQIRPLGPPGSWDCTARIQFPSGGLGDPANFYTLTLQDQDSPSWANVIISPAAITGQWNQNENTEQTLSFQVSVALTQNAPAFEATKITIGGSVQAPNQNFPVAPTQITITPGYFNLYNVRLDKKIGQGGPQDSVDYPIQIDNFSNGQTRFEFALVSPDNLPAGFQPVVPEPVVLQSQAGGGDQTQGQVTFSVYTPFQNGYVNEIGAIQLRIDSFYAPDTTIEGASSQVSTLTQARGFYVPGPGAPLMILGMLGAALGLAKITRKDD